MRKQTEKKLKKKDGAEILNVLFKQRNKWWLVLILVVITFITFSPSLNNDFVTWDDNQYVTENELIKEISINNLGKFGENVAGNFHPLTMISLALDYHFFGMNPFYFHLKNLIFHLLNTILVFFFILKVSKNNWFVSFLTALMFGIHPMHVESVAWVSERKDVLFTFYFLAGLLLYYEYHQKRKILFYLFTLIAFVLSVLSKSAAVVFPVVLLLIDFYENKKLQLKPILQKIPFFIVALIFGIIALKTQSEVGAIEKADFTFFERIRMATGGNWIYLKKFFIPVPLTNYYPIPDFTNSSSFYLQSLLVFVLFGFVIIRFLKRTWWISWGFIFYLTTIILVLQFLQVGGSFVSDRYTYLPYIGLGFSYFMLVYILIEKFENLKFVIVSLLFLQFGFWAVKAYSQTKVWTNTETLWTRFIDVYPNDSSNGHNNLGEYYLNKGDTAKAIIQFDLAVEIGPNNFRAYSMRGKYYYETKNYDQAIQNFSKALSLKENDPESLKGRSVSYFFNEDINNATRDIKLYLSIDSTQPDAYNLLGNIYLNQNNLDLALINFEKAITLDKNYQAALNNRGMVLGLKNDDTAQEQLTKLIDSDNQNYEALTNRGVLRYKNRDYENALSDFNAALIIKSNYAEALRGRSAIYFDNNQFEKAIEDITQYLKNNPDNYDILNRRALCYIRTNQYQKAIDDLNQLILAQPANGLHYQGRGLMYLRLGNSEKALDDLLMANELGVDVDANILRALQTQ